MSVDAIGLSSELLKAVKACGYKNLTPIQQQAIPLIRSGVDLLASAQTGTGKTAAFSLPILDLIAKNSNDKDANNRTIKALILTPTRELALQVAKNISEYSQFLPLTSGVVTGGANADPQVRMLKTGVDVLIATPGRLIEHLNARHVNLSHIKHLVLDEADRMLDMGFIHDIKKILKALPPKRQNLLFSATFSDDIRALAKGLVNNPVEISVTPRNTTVEKIEQVLYEVDKTKKTALLSQLILENKWQQVLVFVKTKHGANRLVKNLEARGIRSAAIHGNKSQGARTKALAQFKESQIKVLVATDIAARGIDIDQLPNVVNFDLPHVSEDYVHRIGRTGRAGNEGLAVSLVCQEEFKLLKDIERFIKKVVPRRVQPGFEPGEPLQASVLDTREKKIKKPKAQKVPHKDGVRSGARTGSAKKQKGPRNNFVGG